MNRLLTLTLIVLAGLLTNCGSSASSTTQAATNFAYSMVVSPILFTLNSGDWATVAATVDVSFDNGVPKPVSPQPEIQYFSSDPRVTVSPSGEVCAGQWDVRYLTCTPSSTLPTGYVTITAYNATRNVGATAQLAIHTRAANISLSADPSSTNSALWPGSSQPWPINTSGPANCISQNKQVQYIAHPLDGKGNGIASCSILPAGAGCVNNNDYTWTVADANVASVSTYGFVVARNPGVTSVYASLNGTISAPATFVTCPPTSIVLGSFPFSSIPPLPPFTTADKSDLDALTKSSELYMTATLTDINGASLVTSPLSYITTNPLTGSFNTVLPLVAQLTANTSGRFSVVAGCEPTNCNAGVQPYALPINAGTVVSGTAAGFGFPIYSNVIGLNVQGSTPSTVLVTGTTLADGVTPVHRLEVFDSESLANTQIVALPNLPNSLVVAPNGATAYVGSSTGLVVVNLATYQPSVHTYPIVGGLSTDVITGQVLGVSPDSRYVVTADNTSAAPNSYVFLIDTTGSKSATRYTIAGTPANTTTGAPAVPANINAVTFAADGSNMWIGGTNGVYAFNADTFVLTSSSKGVSTNVNALAWMPDGQSYFASGAQLVNYSTCNDTKPLPANSTTGSINLDTIALNGVPEVVGLAGAEWLDYTATNSSPNGNVCQSTVSVAAEAGTPVPSGLPASCTPTQVTFSPRLEAEFVTGGNASTTATASAGSASITVASTNGIVVGQTITGPGVASGTTVTAISGTTITISQATTAALSGTTVQFSGSCSDTTIHGYSVATHSVTPPIFTAPGTSIAPLSGGVLSDGRKLFVGTYTAPTSTAGGTATLLRFDLSTGKATTGNLLDGSLTEDLSTSVDLVPSFVAVVPK